MEGEKLEGSLRSYLVVLGSFAIHFVLLGFLYTFGVYQEEFSVSFKESHANVAWVGTGLATVSILFGPCSGSLADRYGFRKLSFFGSLIFCSSLVTASFSSKLWHLILSIGVLNGLGISLAYYPAIAVVSHWWTVNRGAANSLSVAGAGIGGLALGPLTQYLITNYGWAWTLRIIAIIAFVILMTASIVITPRTVLDTTGVARSTASRSTSHVSDAHRAQGTSDDQTTVANAGFMCISLCRQLFGMKQFTLLFCACFFECFAYYVPFFYIVSYAVDKGISVQYAATLLGVMNGASGLGRVLLGRVGDTFGYLNCFLYCMCVATMGLYLWVICTTEWMLMALCIMFGFHVGGYIALQAPMLATVFGVEKLSGLLGILYSAGVPGTLFGSVIAGKIIDLYAPNYQPVILFTAGTYTLNILFLLRVWWQQRRLTLEGTEKQSLMTGHSQSKYVIGRERSHSQMPPSRQQSNNSIVSSDSEDAYATTEGVPNNLHCDYTRV